jgi:hypothetical protein
MIGYVKSWEQLARENGGDTAFGRKIDKIDSGTRASMDGQVSKDMSYGEWLRDKDKTDPAGVREMLGKERYDLWKKEKLTMRQLVDNRGNPLRIDEL